MPTPVSLGVTSGSTNTTTIALTAGSSIQTGDHVAVAIGWDAATTISSVSDGTNTYTQDVASGSTNTIHTAWWHCENATAVASPTITVTFSGSTGFRHMAAFRTPGMATSTSLDKTNSVEATSSTPSIATGVLSQASEIVFGCVLANNSGGTPTVTEPSGFTQIAATTSTGMNFDCSYDAVAATTSVTYNPTLSTSQVLGAAVASYKVAAVGTAVASTMMMMGVGS